MTTVAPEHLTITAADAERYLGIKASSIRAWAAVGRLVPKNRAVGEGREYKQDGTAVYLVSELLEMAAESKRWKPKAAARPVAWARRLDDSTGVS